jgi:hypothetical protein
MFCDLALFSCIYCCALFFFLICIFQLRPLGTAATNRPVVSARVIMAMEKFVEWMKEETEVLE